MSFVRKEWESSKVENPVAVARRICQKSPTSKGKVLVEKCVEAGVARGTANVTVSRFLKARKKGKK